MDDASVDTVELQGWIARIQAGDASARDELLERTAKRLEGLARRLFKRFPSIQAWTESGDVLQNALLRLLRALDNVEIRSVREFFGLAATQIRRELLDLVRHYHGPLGEARHRAGQLTETEPGLEPSSPTMDEGELEAWCRFHEHVESLPVEEREVVGLIYYHGWTREEVAELFHVNERTVRRRWKTALSKLQSGLSEESD